VNITRAILVKMYPIYIQICCKPRICNLYISKKRNQHRDVRLSFLMQFKIMNYLSNYDSVCPFVIKLRLGLLAYDQLFIKSIIINDTTIRDIMRYHWPRKQVIKKYIIMQHIQQVA
jgi:hypothetical protein